MPGRKSTASLTVVKTVPLDQRQQAPSFLTARQREIWKSVVDSKAADYFSNDTKPLLVAYVKAVEAHELLSVRVESFDMDMLADMDGIKLLDRLQAMQERQGRLFQSLATRMRLTQQSRYQNTTAAIKGKSGASTVGVRPWDAPG
jgi:hypothetical protein